MAWTLPAARRRPSTLGLVEGRLRDCPGSPNCVSSQALSDEFRVEPIPYACTRTEARARLIAMLERDPRAHIATEREDYLHVEWQAWVFVDDLEFYLPPDERVIHVRSASRVGHSDLGANRRRVLALRAAFSSRG